MPGNKECQGSSSKISLSRKRSRWPWCMARMTLAGDKWHVFVAFRASSQFCLPNPHCCLPLPSYLSLLPNDILSSSTSKLSSNSIFQIWKYIFYLPHYHPLFKYQINFSPKHFCLTLPPLPWIGSQENWVLISVLLLPSNATALHNFLTLRGLISPICQKRGPASLVSRLFSGSLISWFHEFS